MTTLFTAARHSFFKCSNLKFRYYLSNSTNQASKCEYAIMIIKNKYVYYMSENKNKSTLLFVKNKTNHAKLNQYLYMYFFLLLSYFLSTPIFMHIFIFIDLFHTGWCGNNDAAILNTVYCFGIIKCESLHTMLKYNAETFHTHTHTAIYILCS